jgi:hypothetical protein
MMFANLLGGRVTRKLLWTLRRGRVRGEPGILCALVPGQRRQDDVEVPVAEHLGGRIRIAKSRDLFDESVHDLKADFLVRFLAALEAQLDPHLVIVAKELDGVVALYRQVVRANNRGKLQLLHPARGLRSADILAPLGLFVKELAVIDDPANRRRGRRGNLDQVETLRLRQPQRVVQSHDAKLLLGFVENPDFTGADFPVPTMERFAGVE